MKHPDRLHEIELSFGKAHVFYPEANPERCEAALVLDIDPVELVRGRGTSDGLLDQYVNDRPYAASSFLSVALNRVFKTAMNGTSRDRQEVADMAIPLDIVVRPLPVHGTPDIVNRLFEPLGWSVKAEVIDGPAGASGYVSLQLSGSMKLADAFGHLYVLIPVLDKDKHYWVGEDEIEKLLDKAGAWLGAHPERDLITRRYLKNRRDLFRAALARLAPDGEGAAESEGRTDSHEDAFEAPLRIHDLRLDTVADALSRTGASTVIDLGCGEGKLLGRLLRNSAFKSIAGLDVSVRSLQRAREKLKIGQPGGPSEDRLKLLHGALTYRDSRWRGTQAAALVEVIEHLDEDRLTDMTELVFGYADLKSIIITTPNAEYNALFPRLTAGAFRHPDHRFEWSRTQFQDWANSLAARYGFQLEISGIGEADETFGSITQMAEFTR